MAAQIQINLSNDTANYRAHQAALSLAQTNRPKNTSRAYNRICQEWRDWCCSHQYDDGDLVHEHKLVRFMTEAVIDRPLRKQQKKRKRDQHEDVNELNNIDPDLLAAAQLTDDMPDDDFAADNPATLKFQSIRGYKVLPGVTRQQSSPQTRRRLVKAYDEGPEDFTASESEGSP